jgi:hypothetical protein
MHKLNKFFRNVVDTPYDDQYDSGVRFFFDLDNFEAAAGQYHVEENRSPEVNAIKQEGGFRTVPKINYPELEQLLWDTIEPTIKKFNVRFISSCMAFSYHPNYTKVNYHLHREALRLHNPSPFNYTFFFCTDPVASATFSVVDHLTPTEDIHKHELINYVSTKNVRDYAAQFPAVDYMLHHGDVMRFDATKTIHGAHLNFEHDAIAAYLVLNGCSDTEPYLAHTCLRHEF